LFEGVKFGGLRHHGSVSANGEAVPIMTVVQRDPDGTIRLHWARKTPQNAAAVNALAGTWARRMRLWWRQSNLYRYWGPSFKV